MHIAWINQHASLVGGAEHYIMATARHFRERGVRSTLFYDPNLPTSSSILDSFDAAFPIVEIHEQLGEVRPDVVFAHQIRPRIAQQLATSALPVVDFLHDHFLFCLRENKYTTLGERTCERPLSAAACYPCLGFLRRSPTPPGFRLRTISEVISAQDSHKQFRAFVTGSQYMANHASIHGFADDRIHVAPLYAEMPAELEFVPRDPTKLLYVGNILRSKGVDVLLEALRYTKAPTHLDIIGDGAYMKDVRALVHELGIQDRVAFLGKKDRRALSEHYRRAACLILPSRSPETFGLVGVEAMSCATPVIASDVGGIREWLVPEKTGLVVPPNDPAALGSAITRLLGNPALARAMGEAGLARYQQCFRPEIHIERLTEIFTNVLQRSFSS